MRIVLCLENEDLSVSDQSLAVHSTRLNGLFQPGFTSDEKIVIDIMAGEPTPGVFAPGTEPYIDIHDGRALQASELDDGDEFHSRFFKKHGFVVLEHESQVSNWDSGAMGATDALGDRSVEQSTAENQVEKFYLPEIDDIIRNHLLPGERLEIEQPPFVLRRGQHTPNPFFGAVVHNDYGRTADDFQENNVAFGTDESGQSWRDRFDRKEVRGYMMINFWRTVHMSQPLQHMPLGVLDASSVAREDMVSTGLKGFTTSGRITNQLSLRYNEEQLWYYYPRMTINEVLVLNLFEYHKTDDGSRVYNTYHSAFEEPNPSGKVEERQSCEHRVGVFLLND